MCTLTGVIQEGHNPSTTHRSLLADDGIKMIELPFKWGGTTPVTTVVRITCVTGRHTVDFMRHGDCKGIHLSTKVITDGTYKVLIYLHVYNIF